MHENQAEQNYSFGKIAFKVSVDGNVDRPTAVIDHMLATASAVTGIEAIQLGFSDGQREQSESHQTCRASVEFGEIKTMVEITFELERHVPKRALNDMVFGAILPKIWETAGLYMGDGQQLTTPPAPLMQAPRRDILSKIDHALGLASPLYEPVEGYEAEQQRSSRRQPQYATR